MQTCVPSHLWNLLDHFFLLCSRLFSPHYKSLSEPLQLISRVAFQLFLKPLKNLTAKLVSLSTMASTLALKRLASSSSLLSRSLRPSAASSRRLFNTNAVREYDSDDRDSDIDRRPDRRVFSPFAFADMLSPFPTRSSLSQILNVMDNLMESPVSGVSGRRSWDARETEEGLQLRVDMPGLGKEDVKVSVEQNTLTIRGEGKKEQDEDESGRRYTSRIDLPEKLYKTSEIKAEMKNGVLKVFVPKIKEEQRNDVFHVNID